MAFFVFPRIGSRCLPCTCVPLVCDPWEVQVREKDVELKHLCSALHTLCQGYPPACAVVEAEVRPNCAPVVPFCVPHIFTQR